MNECGQPQNLKPLAVIVGSAEDKVQKMKLILEENGYLPFCCPKVAKEKGMIITDRVSILITISKNSQDFENIDLSRFKYEFPCAKLVCLCESIHPMVEKKMRQAGSIFVGSFESFRKNGASIIQRVANCLESGAN